MSLVLNNIFYRAGDVSILEDVSLSVEKNEIVSLVGPNGAGKSTLLNILTGDISPDSGDVFYEGQNLNDLNILDRSFYRSVMSQSQQIVFDFSVKEIIEMGWLDRGNAEFSKHFDQAVSDIATLCQLKHLLNRKFNKLSGGEQRRVHFARTLLQLWRPSNSKDAAYMLLDEPTANLDLYFEIKLMNIIKNRTINNVGVLIIMHDLNLAAKYSDKIALISGGKIVEYGAPNEVLKSNILEKIYNLKMNVDKNLKVSYF
tara:strand:- start:15668 stop:16438 length:771 start_codon:yes stop_codon:yes gene_type:complete